MIGQPSKEYVELILSDEAQCLQQAMGWAQKGTWVVIKRRPELVTETDDYVATYKAADAWHCQEHWPKVPTLQSLLQIIEGGGCQIQFWTKAGRKGAHQGRHYHITAVRDKKNIGNEMGDDIMLTAAKLAIRVLRRDEPIVAPTRDDHQE